MDVGGLITTLSGSTVEPDVTGPQVFAALTQLITVRNLVDHAVAEHVSAMERLGVVRKAGGRTPALLITMGLAPAVASRMVRLAASLDGCEAAARHFADGAISGEHADAVTRGVSHIESRTAEKLSDQELDEHEIALLAQVLSGASPAEVAAHARGIGNQLAADDPTAVPPAEDRSLNCLDHCQTADGRLRIRADVDVIVGEKFVTLIDTWSQPRPEPDGSTDTRTASRRRADALETILDRAAGGVETAETQPLLGGAPKTEIMLTIPVDTPDLAALQWLGLISQAVTRQLSCDPAVTEVVLDGHDVPLDVGRSKRICPPSLRKAVILRDGGGCIKCGAPAAWAHIHHMQHWSDGGATSLDNLCVLCPSCHADVHALGWEIMLGHDRHPWLIPPAEVDPARRPLRAHHRNGCASPAYPTPPQPERAEAGTRRSLKAPACTPCSLIAKPEARSPKPEARSLESEATDLRPVRRGRARSLTSP